MQWQLSYVCDVSERLLTFEGIDEECSYCLIQVLFDIILMPLRCFCWHFKVSQTLINSTLILLIFFNRNFAPLYFFILLWGNNKVYIQSRKNNMCNCASPHMSCFMWELGIGPATGCTAANCPNKHSSKFGVKICISFIRFII